MTWWVKNPPYSSSLQLLRAATDPRVGEKRPPWGAGRALPGVTAGCKGCCLRLPSLPGTARPRIKSGATYRVGQGKAQSRANDGLRVGDLRGAIWQFMAAAKGEPTLVALVAAKSPSRGGGPAMARRPIGLDSALGCFSQTANPADRRCAALLLGFALPRPIPGLRPCAPQTVPRTDCQLRWTGAHPLPKRLTFQPDADVSGLCLP